MAAALLLPISSSSPQSIFFQRPHYSSRSRSSFVPLTHTRSLTNPHFIPLCSPSPASLVEENSSPILSDGVSTKPESSIEETEKLPLRGCKACGREEVEKGCNGEGRVQGGIATVPGFGWWPIKAYRPCPGFVASGGRYRRRGQSMDEVAWGRTEREASMVSTDDVQSSTKNQSTETQSPRRFKK